MALSRKELLRLQKGQGKPEETRKQIAVQKSPEPNKYLNIIKEDINSLYELLTGGIRKYLRRKGEQKDFMEHYFPELKQE